MRAKRLKPLPYLFALPTGTELGFVPLSGTAVVMDDELAATQLFTTKTASLFLLSLRAAWGTRMCFSLLGPFCHVSSCWGSLQWDYRLFLLS